MKQCEILFKGKRLDIGEWVEGLIITNKKGVFIVTEENPHICREYGYIEIDEFEQIDPETLGQYTGKDDRNNKKIFKGDIIKLFPDQDSKNYREVTWEGGAYVVRQIHGKANFPLYFASIGSAISGEDWEVVGNIHDNKELLKK